MKNLVFYVVFIAAMAFFVSCEKNNVDETPTPMQMTLTFQDAGAVGFSLSGAGLITVDFGDGTPALTYMLGSVDIAYMYPTPAVRTITITGDNIWYLNCSNSKLTSLDISKNTVLTQLSCSNNKLTNLDVSKNTMLTYLDCTVNQLTTLDLSKNTVLSRLFCTSNQLANLDVSKNTMLTYLDCSSNQLTSLDVSNCTVLKTLCCYSNQFSTTALNDIFNALSLGYSGELYINDNPGSETCDRDIALNKGWRFYG